MNIAAILERVKKEEIIDEVTVKKLCKVLREILIEESNLEPISSPVVVVGDLHGQFYDVLKMFSIGGQAPDTQYVFLGDYVDRGYHSVETILLLFCIKILHPTRICLLRGNHESRQISCMHGFYQEVTRKYGNSNPWKYINDTFDYLPLAAVIDSKFISNSDEVFCVHGGLSPDIRALDQIRDIDRVCEVPVEGPFSDLLWSDPEQIEGWTAGSRGAGWRFGWKVVDEFNHLNGLELIARAHQLANEGFVECFDKKNLVTVWSAPNYCYRCNNLASIMLIKKGVPREFKTYTADERSATSTFYNNVIPYFL